MADGSVLGRELGVRVLWGPSEAEQLTADVAVDALFPVGTRLWKEDAGPIPTRSAGDAAPDKVVVSLCPPDLVLCVET